MYVGFQNLCDYSDNWEPSVKRRRVSLDQGHVELRHLRKSVKHLATEDEQPNKGKIYGRRGDGRFAPKSQILHSLQGRKQHDPVKTDRQFDEVYLNNMYRTPSKRRDSRMHIDMAVMTTGTVG